jgi:hypothetical protein
MTGDKVNYGIGCNGPPGYMGWRAGTTTLQYAGADFISPVIIYEFGYRTGEHCTDSRVLRYINYYY